MSAESMLTFDGSKLSLLYSSGDDGGEFFLNKSATNTTINNGVTIDIYKNRLRFFEQGGTSRGFYLDITTGGSGASTNLASSGGGFGGGGGTPLGGGTTTDLIQFQIISEGSTISDGFKGFRYIDSDMTIGKVNLFSNGTASIGITVKIEEATIGTMSLVYQKNLEDSVLDGWTTSLEKGTYLEFYVDSPGGTSTKIPATIVLSIEVTKII